MGVLVFAEESHVHEHMVVEENKNVVNSEGSSGGGNSNSNTGVVFNNNNKIHNTPPAPKKKWIQHYLHEEYPHEINKRNGNSIFRESPVISRAPSIISNTTQSIIHHSDNQLHHIVHQNNHNNTTHSSYIDNNNANHAQTGGGSTVSLIDIEQTQDNKKNRNGSCVIRSGTREVHNKLEKNRRAHLKECFEDLKKQLPAQDEKKSSNLSILHAAIAHIKVLKQKERENEHEMEKLAREKISAQQRLFQLQKELSSKWEHIDFNKLLPEQISTVDTIAITNENMDVDVTSLARDGTIYSSTSSLSSSSITASSPQNHQTSTTSSIHSQVSTSAVVCQTQGLNLANNNINNNNSNNNSNSINTNNNNSCNISNINNNNNNNNNNNINLRESPNSSPGRTITSIPTSTHDKLNNSNMQQSHQIHLPLNAQVLNTNHQNITTIMPTLQHLGAGIRVIPGDTRQLLVTHTTTGNNNDTRPLTLAVQNSNDQTNRPLIAVQSNSTGDTRPVALVVHSSNTNDNRVTLVHPNLTNQTSTNDVRPFTFVNEGRPLVLATHQPPPPLSNSTTAQTRLRTIEAQTSHKMIGGVTLVGSNGSELTRLPGGAELNILPGVFRSVKSQPLTVQGGLALSHTGLSLQSSNNKSTSSVIQTTSSSDGIAHIVTQHSSLTGLTPMTVVSQGNQVTTHILGTSKMITTPILKSVNQVPIVNAQYLNTKTIVKPVVVVTTSSSLSPPSSSSSSSTTTIPSSTQSSVTSHSNV